MVEQMDSGVETGNSSQQQQEVPASQTDPEPDSGLSLRRSHEALQEYLDGEQDIQSFLRTGESNDSGLGLEVEDLSNMGYRIPLGYPPETD